MSEVLWPDDLNAIGKVGDEDSEYLAIAKSVDGAGYAAENPLRSPFRYMGTYRHMAPALCSAIPEHDIWIEPFVGPADMLMAKRKSKSEVINDLDTRIMSDLDILIPPEQLSAALDALTEKGYKELEVSYDPAKLHHWAPLMRPGEYGTIELHRQALNRFVTQVIPTKKIWQAAKSMTKDGVLYFLPSPTHSILICMLHSREFNLSDDPRQFNLRALHDLAATGTRYPAEIDWLKVHRHMKNHGLGYVAEAQLLATKRLLGMHLPTAIMPGPSARLHHFISLAAMKWSLIELLSRRIYDFSAFQIRQRYGCALRSVRLAAYRLRCLFSILKYNLSNL